MRHTTRSSARFLNSFLHDPSTHELFRVPLVESEPVLVEVTSHLSVPADYTVEQREVWAEWDRAQRGELITRAA